MAKKQETKVKPQTGPDLKEEMLKNRRERALTTAIEVVSNPLFTFGNTPLNRDIRGVMRLADALTMYIEGYPVDTIFPPAPSAPEQETPTED